MSDAETIRTTAAAEALLRRQGNGREEALAPSPLGATGAEDAIGSDAIAGSMPAASAAWELAKRAISFPVMLGGLLVGAVFGVVLAFNVDPDLWWHIRTGELILSTHRWATTDPYSYTSFGARCMSCEWLGAVFFAVV